jgi:hypothetical protein
MNCKKQTPDAEVHCRHCGVRLDLTFDEISAKLGKQIHSEQQDRTEAFIRWVLLFVMILVCGGVIFKSFWATPPVTTLTPGYMPLHTIPIQWQPIHQPLVIRE